MVVQARQVASRADLTVENAVRMEKPSTNRGCCKLVFPNRSGSRIVVAGN